MSGYTISAATAAGTMTIDLSDVSFIGGWITLYDLRRDLRAALAEDDLAASLALARRPVIRDQGPPPVRRERAPRRMHPPTRRLSWLVEGRRP